MKNIIKILTFPATLNEKFGRKLPSKLERAITGIMESSFPRNCFKFQLATTLSRQSNVSCMETVNFTTKVKMHSKWLFRMRMYYKKNFWTSEVC